MHTEEALEITITRVTKEREAEKGQEKERGKGRDRPREKFISITKEDLWALQGVLDSRHSSSSSTCKKNSEANNKAHDLSKKTMAALDRLADVALCGRMSLPKATCCLLQKRTQLARWRRTGSTRSAFWMSWRASAEAWIALSGHLATAVLFTRQRGPTCRK